MAELEARLRDRRIIEHRDEAGRIGHHDVVEEGFVPVAKFDQIDVAVEIGEPAIELLLNALRLPYERLDRVRKQALEPVLPPLLDGESRAMRRDGVAEQSHATRKIFWCRYVLVHFAFRSG